MASDPELAAELAEEIEHLELDTAAHQAEHALEVELPLLHHFAPTTKVVGIALDGDGRAAIYEVVLERNGLKLDYVEQEVSAGDLPRQYARLLNAEADTAALMMSRRYVAHTGATFEITLNLYPASRYSVRSVIRQRV